MSMAVGSRLGQYEILAQLGAGGMGEVYRARDTQLNREVAIKVLPDAFALDQERLARFTREAQTLAALNHPNIAQIYGLERGPADAGAYRSALVMELVEGEDLAVLIARGPIPLNDALPIVRQIADALEAAHEAGIIHRDLKPANIKIRPDGTVKVLDFGLAKAIEPVGGRPNAATLTSPAVTGLGVILGTAAYMSPEQARGKPVDRRADIWAFGAVLYEMLTGARPFDGETMTDALSAIVAREPDWRALPPAADRAVGTLLRRCLEKDPRKRLQAIGEARIALEQPAASTDPVAGVRSISAPLVALLVIGSLSVGALAAWMFTRGAAPPPRGGEARLALPIGPKPSLAGAFVLSKDGTQLAFVGQLSGKNHIFLRQLAQDDATQIAGTEGASLAGPAFSPDGRWLAFAATGTLKKVPVNGGPAIVLADSTTSATSRPFWGEDDTIVFSNALRGLSRISAAGGQAQVVSSPDAKRAEVIHENPWLLPDAKTLLFGVRRSTTAGSTIITAQTLSTGERRELFPGVLLGMVGSDQLIVAKDAAVLSIPFDTREVRARGEPQLLFNDFVALSRGLFSFVPQFTIARNGTAVYLPATDRDMTPPLMAIEQSGSGVRIAAPARQYSDPRVSPDGRRIAVHVFEEGRDNWVLDLRNGAFTKLTFDPGEDETPVWSPDGRWIYWTATRGNVSRAIYRKSSDGSGAEQLIWSGEPHIHLGGVTPDGATLVISMIEGQYTRLARVDVASGKLTLLLNTPFTNTTPALSPDGRWLAYASNESGSSEVYVQAFPSMESRTQVSAGGGSEPVWSRNGRELYFRGSDKFMAVGVSTSSGFSATPPRPLFTDSLANPQGGGHTGYDVTPDGKFVMASSPSAVAGAVTHLRVVYRP